MISLAEKNKCSGCAACSQVCPKNCISMVADEFGFLYPLTDVSKCIECGKCASVCPVISKNTPNNTTAAYAVKNNDEVIREKSSSGGFFTMLAEYVLGKNGVVFGAALNDGLAVEHICVSKWEELERLRDSKYVQSEIGDTFKKAKAFLEQGTLVLYTGTPCQIEGLLSYLGKHYENLITQDIICHGVPSPQLWSKYLEWQKRKVNSKPEEVSFRNKISGWKNFSMMLKFQNGEKKYHSLKEDLFLRSFLSDLCLRSSCYDCTFKSVSRPSDFTLADFWNVHKVIEGFEDDDKGTSLVFVNSIKAAEMFNQIQEGAQIITVDPNEAVKYNSAATQSVVMPAARNEFLTQALTGDFEKSVEKYSPKTKNSDSLWYKIVRKAKKFIK